MLERLRESPAVAEAFYEVCPDKGRWYVLISDCITAEERTRTHRPILEAVARSRDKAADAAKGLALVRAYLRPNVPRRGGANWFTPLDPVDEALRILGNAIADTTRHNDEFLQANSRKKDARAAQSAGIAWIKESVLRVSGEPNARHVAALAQAALGLDDVSTKAVEKSVIPSDRRDRAFSPVRRQKID